jgi:hypothetical protein
MTRDMMNVIEQILDDGHLNTETLAQLRAVYYAEPPPPVAKQLPSDKRLWHIISRYQRDFGLVETVPLNAAMFGACQDAMADVDVVPQPDHRAVMRQALDALESFDGVGDVMTWEKQGSKCYTAIAVLRAVLGEGND